MDQALLSSLRIVLVALLALSTSCGRSSNTPINLLDDSLADAVSDRGVPADTVGETSIIDGSGQGEQKGGDVTGTDQDINPDLSLLDGILDYIGDGSDDMDDTSDDLGDSAEDSADIPSPFPTLITSLCPPGEHFALDGQCGLCSGAPDGQWIYGDTLPPEDEFTVVTVAIELPPDTTHVRIAQVLFGSGWLETDSYFFTHSLYADDVGNLVTNPSVEVPATVEAELPLNWVTNSWGDLEASFSYMDFAPDGDKALKVTVISGTEGDAKWWSRPFPVLEGGGPYEFSVMYRSNTWTDMVVLPLSGGTALVGEPLILDDQNSCTDDLCNAEAGLLHINNAADCDDNDPETTKDICIEGVCTGQLLACPPGEWTAVSKYWCHLCNDEGTDFTNEGAPLDEDQCFVSICDSVLGVVDTPLDNVPCWDADACTEEDTCLAGICTGSPISCNDYSDCTVDSCAIDSGCHHEIVDGPCDDGLSFFDDDTCINGVCIGLLDADGDGVPNYGFGPICTGLNTPPDCTDNCPYRPNANQKDSNSDGTGDECAMPMWWLRVTTTQKVVALTFDDGWDDTSLNEIVSILSENNVKGTFFVNGLNLAAEYVEMETMMKARYAGHLLGNHTFHHAVGQETAAAIDEIMLNEEYYVDEGLGSIRPLFRLPSPDLEDPQLWVHAALLQTGFVESILGTIDPRDWTEPAPPVDALVDCILEQVEPGDIIAFHVGPAVTVEALPAIIEGLAAKDYKMVTVEQLLAFGEPFYMFDPAEVTEVKSCEEYYE
jgi:peptidoglycan/xylan/chitin deacetylase (PgdA/CDA1 family)